MSHVGQQEHNNANGQWEGRSGNPPNCGNRAPQAHMTRSYFRSQETYCRWRVWEWVWLLQRRVVTRVRGFFLSSYLNPEVNTREMLLRYVFIITQFTFFFQFQVATVTDIESVIRHPTLSDGCTAPMGVTTALVFDPVGRLMQLLPAPQIWAVDLDAMPQLRAVSDSHANIWRNYRSTDDEVLYNKASEAALLTKLSFQLQLPLLYLTSNYQRCCYWTETSAAWRSG